MNQNNFRLYNKPNEFLQMSVNFYSYITWKSTICQTDLYVLKFKEEWLCWIFITDVALFSKVYL